MNDIVRKDRRLSIKTIAEQVNIDEETVRQIVRDRLDVTWVGAKTVPNNLSREQKKNGSLSVKQILAEIHRIHQNSVRASVDWFGNLKSR